MRSSDEVLTSLILLGMTLEFSFSDLQIDHEAVHRDHDRYHGLAGTTDEAWGKKPLDESVRMSCTQMTLCGNRRGMPVM